jgi:hypothetical protein
MATFDKVLKAMSEGKRFRHDDWYDGQFLLWENKEKHLMLSPKFLLSDKWQIQDDVENSVEKETDDSVKKKHQVKK